ncbi:kinase-like protein [Mytilinidion resinicola]|uniref:non-specific serine/threonine protein kinase n=1 Tax=Mytilinidion resinicola TaxID=574789 RepID=A0A6A6YTZ4_9PEZI|nr:kinase-like protein [Mytilinidion resinicola]KAF2811445.1 kinase-like protein [Mytilinidion resinicola]
MAPPKSPWNKIATNASSQNAFPAMGMGKSPTKENKPATPASAPVSETYAKAQDDEIEVLQAIFPDEYEEVEFKGAWSKTTDRTFRLRLKPFSESDIVAVLSVRLLATYPKTVPILVLENATQLRPKTRQKIEALIKTKPKELLGEVMIHEIATAIQDILEDDVTAREHDETLPSLEEERAVHEAAANLLAKEQEEEKIKKKVEEKAEEDRVMQQMVEEELRRKELMVKRRSRPTIGQTPSSSAAGVSLPAHVTFDRLVSLQDDGNRIDFDTVTGLTKLHQGPVTEVLLVQPTGFRDTLLALKKTKVYSSEPSSETRLKRAILEFENDLEELKKLRQSNIVHILDFKIQRLDNQPSGAAWDINILTAFANRGSLREKLEEDGSLATDRVRSWSIELLEALDFFHRNGVVHKRIHPGNILLCRPPSGGATFTKLADAGYQESLYNLKDLTRATAPFSTPRSAFWVPSELSQEVSTRRTRKTDVWDLGVVFLQMLFGLGTPQKHASPTALITDLQLSDALGDIVRKFFRPDPKKRPSAFDLIPCEFLRNDIPVYFRPISPVHSRTPSTSFAIHGRRARRESSTGVLNPFSRYASEWAEAGRLGKGGYGEVVKARNKLDGRFYAIKKIKQNSAAALTEVLSEVMLLSRLNHPCVVRYFTAWPEEEATTVSETDGESSNTFTRDDSSETSQSGDFVEFGRSTGGLDFISSKTGFDDESDYEDDEDDDGVVFGTSGDEKEDGDGTSGFKSLPKATRITSNSRPVKTTLYIQMEYCEKQTLRDLIRKGLYEEPEEYWRLLRQVLEGLAHIHGHGIIHRDLKPDNVFIDVAKIPKIGDFGLATSGQYHRVDKGASSSNNIDGDMTHSVGTALYVAPELRSGAGGSYNDKVDMYSLGIIFFEMCHPLKTAMERDHVIRALREKQHTLPDDFQGAEKALEGSIITSLISHRPSERPSCVELLRSGKVPLQIEDEAIKEALKALSDRNSPHYQKMMAALFSQKPDNQVKDFAWDMGTATGVHSLKASDVGLQNLIEDRLSMIFRSHGAVKTQRQLLLPWADHYSNSSVVKLFDTSGTLVQLPYDLTLPYARSLGRGAPTLEKTYTIGTVFRNNYAIGAPRSNGEADFDIVSYDTLDLALKEAEVIKVIDEVTQDFPSLKSAQMCFHLNHSDLLELILDFCRINVPLRPSVKEVLSKLNIQPFTWQKIRNELRAPEIGVSSTSLDDLAKFDWRDSPEKAFAKLRRTFEGTKHLEQTHAVFAHLKTVIAYMKNWDVKRKAYICPLSSVNEKFYSGGILFQCLYDSKRREVLAAGGRYDRLIEEYCPKGQSQLTGTHAVGMNLGWDRLISSMARYLKNPPKSHFLKKGAASKDGGDEEPEHSWIPRRCDILVASFDSTILRSTGVKLVSSLIWQGFNAELARDARSPEELLSHYKDDNISWVVIIKHDASASGKPDIKVKSIDKKEDTDIRSTELLSYLKAEIRDRDQREGASLQQRHALSRTISGKDDSSSSSPKADVDVLVAERKSKKTNKWGIIEAARSRSSDLLDTFKSAPIAAIETKDEIMDLVRDTRLSDPDSWRRAIQSLPLVERKYLQDLHDLLLKYASKWREEKDSLRTGEGGKAFVYNFRTQGCLLYDLEA